MKNNKHWWWYQTEMKGEDWWEQADMSEKCFLKWQNYGLAEKMGYVVDESKD